MIKFAEGDLDGYERVRNVLEGFMREAEPVIRGRMQGLKGDLIIRSINRQSANDVCYRSDSGQTQKPV